MIDRKDVDNLFKIIRNAEKVMRCAILSGDDDIIKEQKAIIDAAHTTVIAIFTPTIEVNPNQKEEGK